MLLFELVIGLLLGGAMLTALARRIGAPYPVLLALAGTGLALAPIDVPGITLDPELALTLFVAPVILDAAYDTSPRDLRENWVPVTGLVLVAVALTVASVAVVARRLVPDMPWSVAIALGAIVAPPDPVSATAVLGPLGPPRRLMVILEGEGLLNDASALLVYRLAVGVALGTTLTPWTAVPLFLANVLGSLVLGWVLARGAAMLTARIADLSLSVVTQFVGTFAVWILAEKLQVSTVLTIVVYAVVLARQGPDQLGAETRRGSFAVWEVAVYVLNALAFILIGLQLQEIGRNVDGGLLPYVGFGLAVLATVILVRLGWTFLYNALVRLAERFTLPAERRTPAGRSYKSALMVGWCGMRGLLTLATALALPLDDKTAIFPHRDLVIVAAFTVVLGTLALQGLTLGPLLKWLDLDDDGRAERERDLARQEATRAALRSLDGNAEPEAAILRKEYGVALQDEAMRALRPKRFGELRMTAIAAERERLFRLRADREIGDDAYRAIEEELDWAEGNARRRARRRGAEPEGRPMTDIKIRDVEDRDLPAILAIHNRAITTSTAIFSFHEVDLDNRRAFVADRLGRGFPFLVAAAPDGAVMGYASFGDFRPHDGYFRTVEHSIYVAEAFRRRGVAGALMVPLIERARAMGKHAMVGGLDAANTASIALHERFGFERVGLLPQVGFKFDRFLDLLFLQKILD